MKKIMITVIAITLAFSVIAMPANAGRRNKIHYSDGFKLGVGMNLANIATNTLGNILSGGRRGYYGRYHRGYASPYDEAYWREVDRIERQRERQYDNAERAKGRIDARHDMGW